MNFTPHQPEAKRVPYFEDVRASDGWEGQGSEKSIDTLRAEVAEAVQRLGGFVAAFREGNFEIDGLNRPGLQLYYTIAGAPGRLDIAGLPCRNPANERRSRNNSLKMALYMVRNALNGMWFLQQLSPGFAPLMPFMIADRNGNTVSQLWAQGSGMAALLPPSDSDFIEGEAHE